MSKQAVVGILAHVDAGKTTLAEAMLFNAGRIRKRGRVDDGDSHLDTNTIERERGITIFSSQAVFDHGGTRVMLVDAPGHVDFSAEAERTLRALDYAILVVGANDGVQGHTETLWRLLARYDIPTFIYINQIDLEHPGRDVLLAQLGQRLSEGCLDANELLAGGAVQEVAAALDEAARAKGETLRGLVNERLKKLGPGKGLLFAIDEAQSASIEELAALAVLYQQVLGDQDATGLPDSDQRGLALVFAGLPSMVDDLLEEPSVTFLRRAQQRTLGAISLPKVRDSYIQTVKDAGLYADAETADLAAHKSMGHPYMVQLVGYYMWRSAVRRGSQVIERRDVEDGHVDAVSEFYEAVDAPLYYGLRSPQRLFIEAMAVDEDKPTRMADIIERCDRTQSWASKYRASLIRERVIEAAGYGLVRFPVPMLGAYIRDRVLWHE